MCRMGITRVNSNETALMLKIQLTFPAYKLTKEEFQDAHCAYKVSAWAGECGDVVFTANPCTGTAVTGRLRPLYLTTTQHTPSPTTLDLRLGNEDVYGVRGEVKARLKLV